MGRKPKRHFSEDQKQKAVEDYVSGRRTAAQIAAEMNIAVTQIYKWKVFFEERSKGQRVDELESQGVPRDQALKVQKLEEELEEYKRKVGEQTIVIDLLKKLQTSRSSVYESAVTGLIDTIKKSAPRKKHLK